MASLTMSDEALVIKYGRRKAGQPLFEPQEFGYRCPKGHGGDYLTWSEFKCHVWCFECKIDYHYAHDCILRRASWMTPKQFTDFLSGLPEKPKVLSGVDRSLERIDKAVKKGKGEE